MKIIIKEGEKFDSIRKKFECTDCGCIFTSDEYTGCYLFEESSRIYSTCPWCRSERAYETEEGK